jgi:hypothetical protein
MAVAFVHQYLSLISRYCSNRFQSDCVRFATVAPGGSTQTSQVTELVSKPAISCSDSNDFGPPRLSRRNRCGDGTVLGRVLNQNALLQKEGNWRFAAVDSNCKCSTGRAPKCKVFGYTFGYRYQFALIAPYYAKLQKGIGLASPLITLSFPYLS